MLKSAMLAKKRISKYFRDNEHDSDENETVISGALTLTRRLTRKLYDEEST